MINRMKPAVACAVLLAALSLSGCSTVSETQKQMYGSNSTIAGSADSYTFGDRSGETKDNESELSFSKFYGTNSIWSVDSNSEATLQVEYDQEIDGGKLKVVLVTPGQEVVTIAEGSGQGVSELLLAAGTSTIKLVGNQGKGSVKLRLQAEDKDVKWTAVGEQ